MQNLSTATIHRCFQCANQQNGAGDGGIGSARQHEQQPRQQREICNFNLYLVRMQMADVRLQVSIDSAVYCRILRSIGRVYDV